MYENGQRQAYSLVNNTSPSFAASPHYQPQAFPFPLPGETLSGVWKSASGSSILGAATLPSDKLRTLCRAHFLALCSKLIYEKPPIMADVSMQPLSLDLHLCILVGD